MGIYLLPVDRHILNPEKLTVNLENKEELPGIIDQHKASNNHHYKSEMLALLKLVMRVHTCCRGRISHHYEISRIRNTEIRDFL